MVLSFAHLKKRKQQPSPPSVTRAPIKETAPPVIILQRAMGIGIMKTARLVAVNYCENCPRFLPADDQDKANGVPYGRCIRDETDEFWIYRSIPLTATVARCWWHQQEHQLDINTYGPHP